MEVHNLEVDARGVGCYEDRSGGLSEQIAGQHRPALGTWSVDSLAGKGPPCWSFQPEIDPHVPCAVSKSLTVVPIIRLSSSRWEEILERRPPADIIVLLGGTACMIWTRVDC